MNQLQSRMGRTAPDEVIRTFAALSGMMTTRGGEKFQEPDRLIIAQQVMRQAAEPTCIDQGYNSTCNVTTIEVRAYARNPGAAAELIAEVTRNGSFRTAGGTTVHPFLPGLKHSESYEQQNPVPDGQRSWATKIFNAIAVNTYWAQQTKTPDGREVPRGSLKYEDYPEFRTNPETGLLEAHPDTGERLVDYSGKHPRMLYSGGELQESPGLPTDTFEQIFYELTGNRESGFVITHESIFKGCDNIVNVSSSEQLSETLQKLKREGKLPAIVQVHTGPGREPFYADSGAGAAGGAGGWHVVSIFDIDPATGAVQIDNQWGSAADHHGAKSVNVASLFNTMTAPVR